MIFPRSDRVIYETNPLVEVICQLRTPAILRVESESPSGFQERVRDQYPEYELEDAPLPVEVSELIQRLGAPMPPGGKTHKFITPDSSRLISIGTHRHLSQTFLALADRSYRRWEKFNSQMRDAERLFVDEYAPAYYTRIGLRYKDRISREQLDLPEQRWATLLKAPVGGFLSDPLVGDSVITSVATTELALQDKPFDGRMRVRYGLQKDTETQESVFIIDVDCFAEGRFEREDAFGVLDQFHDISGNFFRWAISDITKSALRPRTLDHIG